MEQFTWILSDPACLLVAGLFLLTALYGGDYAFGNSDVARGTGQLAANIWNVALVPLTIIGRGIELFWNAFTAICRFVFWVLMIPVRIVALFVLAVMQLTVRVHLLPGILLGWRMKYFRQEDEMPLVLAFIFPGAACALVGIPYVVVCNICPALVPGIHYLSIGLFSVLSIGSYLKSRKWPQQQRMLNHPTEFSGISSFIALAAFNLLLNPPPHYSLNRPDAPYMLTLVLAGIEAALIWGIGTYITRLRLVRLNSVQTA